MSKDGSGRTLKNLFAYYDHKSSSWKMSQACLPLMGEPPLEKLSVHWPRCGMTVNGMLYQQPTLVRRISASASGSWPTPTARDYKGCGANGRTRDGKIQVDTLDWAVWRWPTPTATDATPFTGGNLFQTKSGSIRARLPDGRTSNRGLTAMVKWPTPDASPRGPTALDLIVNDSTVKRRGSGQHRGINLQTAVKLRDGSSTVKLEGSGSLNPAWVEWLMGYPAEWTDLED